MECLVVTQSTSKDEFVNPFLFRFGWLELVSPDYGNYDEPLVTIREGDLEKTPKTGTELFNMIRDKYLWELNDQSV